MSDPRYELTDAKTIPLRPLKGIYRDISTTLIPTGGFYDVDGYIPDDSGIIRRFGFEELNVEFPDVDRWDHLSSFIDDQGVKITYGIAGGEFFVLAGQGFIPIPCEYPSTQFDPLSTVSISAGDRLVIGNSETHWLTEAGISRGDQLSINGGETFTITSVVDDKTLRIEQVPVSDGTDLGYKIKRMLTPAADWSIQTVRLDRTIFVVTGKNTVMVFDIDQNDGVYTYWELAKLKGIVLTSEPEHRNFIPKTIEVFKDRIWLGNIFSEKADRLYSYRITWTPILNPLDFLPDRQYTDLVQIGGEISALQTLGNLLMTYFEFGIQFGRETQIPGDVLPLAFDKVQTAVRGVLQPEAVASAMGGHFYVSTDNVYYIGQNLQVKSIGDNIKELLFRRELVKSRYAIKNFFEAEGILIGASTSEGSYEEIYGYNFGTQQWTRFQINADNISVFALGSRLTYMDYGENQIYGADPQNPCNNATWDTDRLPGTEYFETYDVRYDDMSNGYGSPFLPADVPFYAAKPEEIDNRRITVPSDYTACLAIYGGSSSVSATNRFYITNGRFIYNFDSAMATEFNGDPILTLIETGDFDLDAIDVYNYI